jgi:hypothetical protein
VLYTVTPLAVLIEIPLLLLALVVALTRRGKAPRPFPGLVRVFDQIARRHGLAVVVVGLTAVADCVLFTLVGGKPAPQIHDEFSYLLAADTYVHGRLANPPHPLWVHFESFHILQQPTYASKYLPAQGAILAVGQALTGYPIVGAWLALGLACAAVCWMLQAWVPSRWALVGGLLAALHPSLLSLWGSSYLPGNTITTMEWLGLSDAGSDSKAHIAININQSPPGSLDADLTGGTLTITDTDATGKDNDLTLSQSGNILSITDANEPFANAPREGRCPTTTTRRSPSMFRTESSSNRVSRN